MSSTSLIESIRLNHVTFVDLTNVDMDRLQMSQLVDALKANHSVKTIYMQLNEFVFEALLGVLMTNTSITTIIDLSRWSITNECALALGCVLKINHTITSIHLRGQMTSIGLAALTTAIKMNHALSIIDLQYNDDCTLACLALADALTVNKSITAVCLLGKSDLDGASALADALKVNNTVERLDVCFHGFGADGMVEFADAIEINTAITHIDLSENRIGKNGASSLARALGLNTTATHINVMYNHIGDDGVASLLEVLDLNQSVMRIDLGCNGIKYTTGWTEKQARNYGFTRSEQNCVLMKSIYT